MGTKNLILDKETVERKLKRMAYEILEDNMEEGLIVLAGIHESGSVVARNIQKMLAEVSSLKTELLTITLDKRQPKEIRLDKQIDFTGKVIIVADDVSNTGRTLLYALKPFLEFHPKKIQTLVLVERTHSNFPVRADYVGTSITTTLQDHITVETAGEIITGAWLH